MRSLILWTNIYTIRHAHLHLRETHRSSEWKWGVTKAGQTEEPVTELQKLAYEQEWLLLVMHSNAPGGPLPTLETSAPQILLPLVQYYYQVFNYTVVLKRRDTAVYLQKTKDSKPCKPDCDLHHLWSHNPGQEETLLPIPKDNTQGGQYRLRQLKTKQVNHIEIYPSHSLRMSNSVGPSASRINKGNPAKKKLIGNTYQRDGPLLQQYQRQMDKIDFLRAVPTHSTWNAFMRSTSGLLKDPSLWTISMWPPNTILI